MAATSFVPRGRSPSNDMPGYGGAPIRPTSTRTRSFRSERTSNSASRSARVVPSFR